ncbi:MAG: Crp/Fnr family transcriptional regulator [Tannerellaceae bacterium]|jgi:CRP-like cAMP-binding protein|nr:Crp/Fnr family transcriptional regulator [Tannerellaceae bacterium]
MNTKKMIAQRLGDILSPLCSSTVDKLASILMCTVLKKNDIFLKEKNVSDQICYVESGLIRQFYSTDDRDVTEHFACENDFIFCIENFLHQKPEYLAIEALEPTVLYGIPYEPLMELIEECPDAGVMYQKLLERILYNLQSKINSFRFETTHERYRNLLNERPEIIKRVPLVHIASFLLMSPETLSRVRSRLLTKW